MFTAVVRVSGAGRLADFRERLRWLMVRDPDAENYTEHHGDGVLEYRFTPRKGIPFPAFAEASGEFPELRVEASWEHDGVRGRASIESGRMVVEAEESAGATGMEVQAGEEGELRLALVVAKSQDRVFGYAATSDRQTYFDYGAGGLRLVGVDEASAELEDIAFRLVDEWIWFDEEDAPVERARYEGYGYPVRGANLRAEKLALLRRHEGARWSTLDAEGESARDALVGQWLKS